LQTLALAEIEMRDGAQIALQELSSSREIESFERIGEELKIGIF
jgi:hypothetical protein